MYLDQRKFVTLIFSKFDELFCLILVFTITLLSQSAFITITKYLFLKLKLTCKRRETSRKQKRGVRKLPSNTLFEIKIVFQDFEEKNR